MKTNESNSLSLSNSPLKSNKHYFQLALILFCAVFLFLGAAGKASAATIYVNPIAGYTNVNGYGDGSNLYTYTDAQNKATPWATVTYALTHVVSGDTVVLNGQLIGSEIIYSELSWIDPQKTNLTLNCEVDYGCIIRGGDATRVFYLTNLDSGIIFHKVVIDASVKTGGGTVASAFQAGANASVMDSVSFVGTKIIGGTNYIGQLQNVTNALMSGCILQDSSSSTSGGFVLIAPSTATMSATITNNTLTQTTLGGAATYGFYLPMTTHMTSLVMSGNIVNAHPAAGTTAYSAVLSYTSDIGTILIHDNNITVSGVNSGTGASGISFYHGSGSMINTSVEIYNNSVILPVGTTGKGVGIGNDGCSGTSGYSWGNVSVYNNSVSGGSHAFLLGCGANNADVYKNYSDNAILGIVTKGNNGVTAHGNLMINTSEAGFWDKGSTNTSYYNNTFLNNGNSSWPCMYISSDTATGVISSGGLYKNNICYSSIVDPLYVTVGGASDASIGTFSNNLYFSSGSSSGRWFYQNTTYSSLSLWVGTGYDSSSFQTNPLFVNNVSDFHLQSASPAINAGVDVGLTTDYDGNPKSGANWDIGAYEFQDSTVPVTTASPTTNTFHTDQTVTLTCDDGAGVGCDKTYYTLDGIDPTTGSTQYSGAITIPSNATTTLKYFSQDLNGNSETIESQTYTIDTTAPNTTISSNPDTLINTNSATFAFSASETSTFQCKIDEEAYATCTSPKNYTSLTEGTHTFYVKATDTATNVDATPASYTFTVDTQVPTISNLSPNNTTLPVTTTSTNLTLTTTETTICKYSTVQNTDYASMTAFDSTNNTTHSTNISNLNAGTTYNYYLKCQDTATNESAEEHPTFSIAPEEQKISLNSIKIKIDRETNKFKDKIYAKEKKLKLQGQDSNLANGQVKIYKNNKLWKTIEANASGAWSKVLKFKKSFLGSLKIRQYDQFGTLLASQKEKIKIDTEKPKIFTASPLYIKHHGSTLAWTASDNDKIDYYRVLIAGRFIKTKLPQIVIPAYAAKGAQTIIISAYDRAGNKMSVEAGLVVSW